MRRLRVIATLLLLCALLTLSAARCFAVDVVRVGFFEAPGIHNINDDGSLSGYGYDYLQEIARYTGWKYEYVFAPLNDCLKMLERGDIDLMDSLSLVGNRQDDFDFSRMEMGRSHAVLYTDGRDLKYAYEDFEAFNGMKVGVMTNAARNGAFLEYAELHDFSVNLVSYGSFSELSAALRSGDVDSVLVSSMVDFPSHRVIARFAPQPMYFAATKGNFRLMRRLDNALEQIKMRSPQFEMQLYNKYFAINAASIPVFSGAEKKALSALPVLRAVYVRGWEPLCYQNEDGKFAGIFADVFKRLSNSTGVRFRFIGAESHAEAVKMIRSGAADVLCVFERDYDAESNYGVLMSVPVFETPIAVLVRRGMKLENRAHEGFRITLGAYDAYSEAVSEGGIERAEGLPVSSFIVSYAVTDRRRNDYMVVNLSNQVHVLGIGVSASLGRDVLSAFNKSLNSATRSDVEAMLLASLVEYKNRSVSPLDIVYLFPLETILVVSAFLLLLLFILFSVAREKAKESKMMEDAMFLDAMTGAWNFEKFSVETEALLLAEMYKNRAVHTKYAMLVVDINHFKFVNERFGRDRGNALLKAFSDMLSRCAHRNRYYARIAGDQFACVIDYMRDEQLEDELKWFCSELSSLPVSLDMDIHISAGIGVFNIPLGSTNVQMAVDNARFALKKAKGSHESRWEYFSEEKLELSENEDKLAKEAPAALKSDQFVPLLLPQVDIISHKVVGADARVHWLYRDHTMLTPDKFVPLFERNRFIIDLDFYIFEQICMLVKCLVEQLRTPLPVSCSFSRVHFVDKGFTDKLNAIVAKYDVSPRFLGIEVSETVVADNISLALEHMRKLRSMRFRLVLDGFGAGNTLLGVMHQLDFDVVKIDKQFIGDDRVTDERKMAVLISIMNIARKMDAQVVCDGVDTKAQEVLLKLVGCRQAQGALYSEPMLASKFLRYMKLRNS